MHSIYDNRTNQYSMFFFNSTNFGPKIKQKPYSMSLSYILKMSLLKGSNKNHILCVCWWPLDGKFVPNNDYIRNASEICHPKRRPPILIDNFIFGVCLVAHYWFVFVSLWHVLKHGISTQIFTRVYTYVSWLQLPINL